MILAQLLSRTAPSSSVFKRQSPGFGINLVEIKTKANPGAPEALVDTCIRSTYEDPFKRPSFGEIIKVLTHSYDALVFDGDSESLPFPFLLSLSCLGNVLTAISAWFLQLTRP